MFFRWKTYRLSSRPDAVRFSDISCRFPHGHKIINATLDTHTHTQTQTVNGLLSVRVCVCVCVVAWQSLEATNRTKLGAIEKPFKYSLELERIGSHEPIMKHTEPDTDTDTFTDTDTYLITVQLQRIIALNRIESSLNIILSFRLNWLNESN